MSVHFADGGHYYAYCVCGICGPSRLREADAKADDRLHASVCSRLAIRLGATK